MTNFSPAVPFKPSPHILASAANGSTTTQPKIRPANKTLHISGPHWRESVAVDRIVRCLIYNSIEPNRQWHDVHIDWNDVRLGKDEWRLPCRVKIPFVGEVLRFEIVGKERLSGVWDISIPFESLIETQPEIASLLTIDLLPDFAAAEHGSEGYLFLPCLSGALHHFRHRVSREERLTINGRQEQWTSKCQYNAFGMWRPALSWFCIVTDGETDAEVVARSHFEEAESYSVHAGFVYRWEHTDELLTGNRTARFYLLDPRDEKQSGWAAFARIYRQFLREERGLRTWHEKAEDNPHIWGLAHGFLMKIMQGYKSASLDGKGKYQSATTFQEARQIIETMREDGIASFLTAQMVGWNQQGHDGLYPTRFPINPVEGGETEFRKLIEWGHGADVCISAHDNYSDSYKISPEFSLDDTIVLRDGRHWCNIPWAGGFNWRVCPLQSLRYAKRDLPRMRELGMQGNYYLDAIASFMTCHSHSHGANRAEMFEAFVKLLKLARETFDTISTEVASAPYFAHVDGVYMDGEEHFLDKFTPFRAQWLDQVVPFAAIVLHNSVRYQRRDDALAGEAGRIGALRTLSIGAMPFVEISARPIPGAHQMPRYKDVARYCRESHQLCCVEHADLVTLDLQDVRELEPDVFHSIFEGGIELYINATDHTVTYAGTTIPPQSVHRIDSY